MTDHDQIIEIAKLDGKEESLVHQFKGDEFDRDCYICGCKPPHKLHRNNKPYLTSRDAIVPVIEKQDGDTMNRFLNELGKTVAIDLEVELKYVDTCDLITATPRQLCEALLRATGKWKE